MSRNWTFGRKLGLGFGLITILALLIGAVGAYALDAVVTSKDRVILVDSQNLIDAQRVQTDIQRRFAAARGYLIMGDRDSLEAYEEANQMLSQTLAQLGRNLTTDEERRALALVHASRDRHQREMEPIFELRRQSSDIAEVNRVFEREVNPARDELVRQVDAFSELEQENLGRMRQASTDFAARASSIELGLGAAVVLLVMVLGVFLTRTLSQQIGGAVSQVRSSSPELQAAANQQATGTREQATAMREISTTITELLATSRQIAESARSVAEISGRAVGSAREGEVTVTRSVESMSAIRRQIDQVVTHMLDLGRKSQQIGGVVDIVAELAEQTNILAINATIEAAGAGEAGRRFAVVADEIRKLADRVAASAKEIRSLIDDVRSSVNTTVMATETGSKTVDSGASQVADVASAFRRINELIGNATDAAREIELSTKQQTSAVEQVNSAVANVTQAARETAASTGQTLQTASLLTGLSGDLLRLVESQRAA